MLLPYHTYGLVLLSIYNFIMKKQLLLILLLTIIHCDWMDTPLTNDGISFDPFFPNNVDAYRATIIGRNVRMVQEHNSDPDATYKMQAYPMFVGLTLEQAKSRYFSTQIQADFDKLTVEGRKVTPVDGNNLKSIVNIDLSQVYRTPVNNQGSCGNCYAYATTDSINMVNKRNQYRVPLLSPQDLTDCSSQIGLSGFRNLGCNGGSLYLSIDYVRVIGINSLERYPISSDTVYKGIPQPCKFYSPKYRIRSWAYFGDTNFFTRISVLQSGYTAAIAVAGGNLPFMYYKNGTLSSCGAGAVVDHAVNLVGVYYNSNSPGSSSFKIKNSWGTLWGQSGFMNIAACQCGTCGVGVLMTQ